MNPMQMLAGLGGSSALVKTGVKYWWLLVPAGMAMYALINARRNRGGQTFETAALIQDFAMSFGPVLPLILLAEMVESREQQAALLAAQQRPVGPVSGLAGARDVPFVAQPRPAQVADVGLDIPQPFPN